MVKCSDKELILKLILHQIIIINNMIINSCVTRLTVVLTNNKF
jgi:hypothetical protein